LPFIAERMPAEAKERLPFTVATDHMGSKATLDLWAVDQARNAYIVLVRKEGGPYEGTQITKHYVLNWQGNLIRISADPLDKTFSEDGATMHWRINKLEIPETLNSMNVEITHLIKDAFRAIGEVFNGERFHAVDVEFKITPYVTYSNNGGSN